MTVESGQIVAIMPYFGSLLVSLIWGTDTKPEMAGDAERGRMEYAGTSKARLTSRRGFSTFAKVAITVAAFALTLSCLLVGIAVFDPSGPLQDRSVMRSPGALSFSERFGMGLAANFPPAAAFPARSVIPSNRGEFNREFEQIEGLLSGRLGEEKTVAPRAAASAVPAIPLPRARPIEANVPPKNDPAPAVADNRTLMQKLADLMPDRIRLASLTPGDGLFVEKPDLGALGYDSFTAVYDISARAVYLPNGTRLEAHSGLGGLMDDPAHVDKRMIGATPPNVYDLKPRERPFHGVQALRMTPVGDSDTLGRSGLLVHSYLLGAKGESNGCVSVKDYPQFLNAFQSGSIKRLAVVPSLSEGLPATRRAQSSL